MIPITFEHGTRTAVSVKDTGSFKTKNSAAATAPSSDPTTVPTATHIVNYNYSNGSGNSTNYTGQTTDATATSVPEVETFSTDAQTLTIAVGQKGYIATSGNDGEYIQAYSSDNTVASVELADGIDGAYTITGISPGTCIITFQSLNGTATTAVTVY